MSKHNHWCCIDRFVGIPKEWRSEPGADYCCACVPHSPCDRNATKVDLTTEEEKVLPSEWIDKEAGKRCRKLGDHAPCEHVIEATIAYLDKFHPRVPKE